MNGKDAIRRQLRASLQQLTPETVAAAASSLRNQLASWPVFRKARIVAVFHPTATEPDLLPLLADPDKTFLFPLCHPDRTLTWHSPTAIDQWTAGPYGIIQPNPALSPAVPTGKLDLVLVPGLAFTAAGDRLGHGAGFYDRFLASLPPTVATAGICFNCQVLPVLPAESHDIRVHHLFHA